MGRSEDPVGWRFAAPGLPLLLKQTRQNLYDQTQGLATTCRMPCTSLQAAGCNAPYQHTIGLACFLMAAGMVRHTAITACDGHTGHHARACHCTLHAVHSQQLAHAQQTRPTLAGLLPQQAALTAAGKTRRSFQDRESLPSLLLVPFHKVPCTFSAQQHQWSGD